MTINIFEILKWECKTHPKDLVFDLKSFNTKGPNINPNMNIYVNVRKIVERQGCNWNWFCEYYNHDVDDQLNFPKNLNIVL